jgi:hypothetical protein
MTYVPLFRLLPPEFADLNANLTHPLRWIQHDACSLRLDRYAGFVNLAVEDSVIDLYSNQP